MFVSLDTDFAGAEKLLSPGTTLGRGTVDGMIESLRARQKAESLQAADERRKLVDRSLHENAKSFAELEQFVQARFRLPDNIDQLEVPRSEVHQIQSLSIVAAEVRNLAPSMNDVSEGESVRLTIFVLTRLDILVRIARLLNPPERLLQQPRFGLGVGEEQERLPKEAWGPDLQEWETTFRPGVIHVVAFIDATAIRTSGGYDKFEPTSIHVPTSRAFSGSRRREADEWVQALKKSGSIK
jgi:hypothetical protein